MGWPIGTNASHDAGSIRLHLAWPRRLQRNRASFRRYREISPTTGWRTIPPCIIFQRSLGPFDTVRLQQPLPNLFKVWRFRLAGGEG